MVHLGPHEKPELKSRYLHLMPEDRLLWQKYIYLGKNKFSKVWYDARVGAGIKIESGQPEWMKRMVDYSYKKRIDIIGLAGLDYYIIECKPGAGVVALGQCIFYSIQFLTEQDPNGMVIPMVITDVVDPDVRPIFDHFGIKIVEVGKVTREDQEIISQRIRDSVIDI